VSKSGRKPFYSADAPSDLALKDPYIDGMMEALRVRGLIGEIDVRTHLILEEAITNAIRHGNRYDLKKRVHIELHETKRGWAALMADEGDGFDPGAVPDPRTAEGMLRESGRGLLIIKSFMDKVEFRDGGATIWCEKFVPGRTAGKPRKAKAPKKPTKPKKGARKRPASSPKRPAKKKAKKRAGKAKAKPEVKKKPAKSSPKRKPAKKKRSAKKGGGARRGGGGGGGGRR